MLKLLKELKWSPNGCVVETIPAGEYQRDELPERAVVIAGELEIIEFIDANGGQQNTEQQPEQQPEAKKGKK